MGVKRSPHSIGMVQGVNSDHMWKYNKHPPCQSKLKNARVTQVVSENTLAVED